MQISAQDGEEDMEEEEEEEKRGRQRERERGNNSGGTNVRHNIFSCRISVDYQKCICKSTRERERGGGRKAHISTSKWGTWDVCVEGGEGRNYVRRVSSAWLYRKLYKTSLDGLREFALQRCAFPASPFPFLPPPSPLYATQLQLHCELNCNEAHAAAKYENEKQKCVLHGSVQGGHGEEEGIG